MNEFFEVFTKLAVLVFVVTCMTKAGLGLKPRDLAAPLRRTRLVVMALLANFVIAPALAYALTQIIPLDRPYAVGLILLGAAAGAPFLPKLAELARGDVAFSVGMMIVLMVGSVIFLPIALPLLIRGSSVTTWPILQPLLFTMLIPLAAGMALRIQREPWALRIQPILAKVSNVSLLLAVLLLVSLNWGALVSTFGSGAAATAVLYVSLLFAAGYALGGPARATRSVMGLGTGQRNVAAGLIIAANNFTDPAVTVMLLVATLAGLIPLLVAAVKLRPRPLSAVLPAEPASHAIPGGVP